MLSAFNLNKNKITPYKHKSNTQHYFARLNLFKLTPDIKVKLDSALHYVLNTSIFGATNKIGDIEKTGGWVSQQDYRYNMQGEYAKTNYMDYIPHYLLYYLMKYKNNHAMLFLLNGIIDMLEYMGSTNPLGNKDVNLDLTIDRHGNYLPRNLKKWHYKIDEIKSACSPEILLVPRNSSQNPLADPAFNLPSNLRRLLERGILRSENRKANCGDRCILIAKYLWENSEGIERIEIVGARTFDHAIVIVNRKGDLHDSATWGDACWVVDAWYDEQGWVFPGNEFKKNIIEIKRYAKEQLDGFKKYNMNMEEPAHPLYEQEELLQHCAYEIKPTEHLYPTYSRQPFIRVDDYYYLMNMYPADMHYHEIKHNIIMRECSKSVIDAVKESHQRKFQACLFAIQHKKGAFDVGSAPAANDSLPRAYT